MLSYIDLCRFVRQQQLDVKRATAVLLRAGYHKATASEVNKVAAASDEVWSQYESRAIGFKLALKKARQGRVAGGRGDVDQSVIWARQIVDLLVREGRPFSTHGARANVYVIPLNGYRVVVEKLAPGAAVATVTGKTRQK